MQPRRTSVYGFTIVELLIVVVVIAILAAIVIVSYNGITNRARISSAQSAVQQALEKIQIYASTNSDTYPPDLATAGVSDSNGTTFAYSVDNNATPKAFCVSATVSGVQYYISQAVSTPTSGTCTVSVATSSVFGSTYPYSATYYSDGGGSLKVATIFYASSGSFTVKGARVYLPSVPSSVSLTIFYVGDFYSGNSTARQPNWSQIPSGISGQYVTIPNASLVTGWNSVTFPTNATINAYSNGVDNTAVWVGYYFSDGNGYVYTSSPSFIGIQSATNSKLWLAEANFEGNSRSSNTLSQYSNGWAQNLYGIDITTVGP